MFDAMNFFNLKLCWGIGDDELEDMFGLGYVLA